MSKIPRWLSSYLDDEGIRRIAETVASAETRTSGEIVPMIVRRSTHSGHVVWVLFFATLSLLIGLVPSMSAITALSVGWLEILAIVSAAIFAWPLAKTNFFQRLCTPAVDRDAAAMMRAELEFFESDIQKTKGKTGVLIFVSLLEREAVVLADEAISSQLPPEAWREVVDFLIQGVKRKDFAGGMCDAIDATAKLLEPILPAQPGNRNELPNKLIIEE